MKLKRWDTDGIIFEMKCNSRTELLKGAVEAKVSFYRANLKDDNLIGINLRLVDFIEADLTNAQLVGADLRGSNLSNANLMGSDLRDANLKGAELTGTNLSKVKFQYCMGNSIEINSMQLDTTLIVFNKQYLSIGCQQHSIEEWKNFTDIKDDYYSKEWWNKWKDFIFKAIELCYGED